MASRQEQILVEVIRRNDESNFAPINSARDVYRSENGDIIIVNHWYGNFTFIFEDGIVAIEGQG